MKKIEAYIRHEAFEPIRAELLDKGFPSLSIIEAKGSGRQKGIVERYRGSTLTVNVRPKIKLEVVVEDKDKDDRRRDDPQARPYGRGRRRQDLRAAGGGGDSHPHRRGRPVRAPTARGVGDPHLAPAFPPEQEPTGRPSGRPVCLWGRGHPACGRVSLGLCLTSGFRSAEAARRSGVPASTAETVGRGEDRAGAAGALDRGRGGAGAGGGADARARLLARGPEERRAGRGGSPSASPRSSSPARRRPTRSRRRRRRPGWSRSWSSASWSSSARRRAERELSKDDVAALRHCARVLAAGFPLVAFLQLVRVYAQSMRRIADAEVRLFHLYVHEPMIRDAVPELEMAEEMGELAADILPLAAPLTEYLHERYLRFFVEQDVVGHMESGRSDGHGRNRARPRQRHPLLHRPHRLHPLHRGGGGHRGARRGRELRRRRSKRRCRGRRRS